MIELKATATKLTCLKPVDISCFVQNEVRVHVHLDRSWDGLTAYLTFKAGDVQKDCPYPYTGNYVPIPPELMVEENIGKIIQIGLAGYDGETTVRSLWCDAGRVFRGILYGTSAVPTMDMLQAIRKDNDETEHAVREMTDSVLAGIRTVEDTAARLDDAVGAAEASAKEAETSKTAASESATAAAGSAAAAAAAEQAAAGSAAAAETAASDAAASQAAAQTASEAAQNAKNAAESANTAAQAAKTAAEAANDNAQDAKTAAQTAQSGAEAAKTSAASSASNAADSAAAAKTSEDNARAAQAAAEAAKDKATEIVGGDFATNQQVAAAVSNHNESADAHEDLREIVRNHTESKNNPHGVTKAQVGLGSVDNTSDANKPVSTAQAAAIADAKKAGTDAESALGTHKSNTTVHITAEERTAWDAKGSYSKPTGGIPKADLASSVQQSLSSADSAAADVAAVKKLIPAQASESNQLADKAFVNSSISTNTAYYISDNGSPFSSLAALQAYTGSLTNNDYAFVVGTDAAGNTQYTRYKYNSATQAWSEEYALNNSSFTAEQWAAIQSGITGAKVEQIAQNSAEIQSLKNQKGAANGIAELDANGKLKDAQKPRYTASEVGSLPDTTSVPTALSDLSDDTTHRVVTDAEKTAWSAKADKPKAIYVTLTADGWDATAKTQTVAVAGVLADGTNQVVDISLADRASSKAWADADVWCDSRGADSLTFSCATVPMVDINLNIELREVRA